MKLQLFALWAIMILMSACSDLNDGEAEGPTIVDKKLAEADCEVVAENFEYLLEKPIEKDIECAYRQVNLLTELVRKALPHLKHKNISKKTLVDYIENNATTAGGVLKYLDLFFTFNNFVIGSEVDHIIANDFKILRDFLLVLNREASKVFKLFIEIDEDEDILISHHRNSLKRIVKTADFILFNAKNDDGEDISLTRLLKRKREKRRSLDLKKVINLFEIESHYESWLFFKRVLLGGNSDFLTVEELLKFIESEHEESTAIKSLKVWYNVFRQPNIRFDHLSKSYSFLHSVKKEVLDLTSHLGNDDVLLNIPELANWLNSLFSKDLVFNGNVIDLSKYYWELSRFKEIYLGSNSSDITKKDFLKVIDLFSETLNIGFDFSKIFTANKRLMDKNKVRIVKSTSFKQISASRGSVDYHKNFKRFDSVMKTYRYFKGDTRIPSYGSDFDRNMKDAIFFGQAEFILDKVFRFYEKEYPCHLNKDYKIYDYVTQREVDRIIYIDYLCNYGFEYEDENYNGDIELNQVYAFILEFKQLLYKLGVVEEGKEDIAAENALSIPDLFSYTANGDAKIQVPELIEFFGNILYASSIKDDIAAMLDVDIKARKKKDRLIGVVSKIKCPIADHDEKGDPLFESDCIRKNFYRFLNSQTTFNDNYMQYLPNLKQFYLEQKRSGHGEALKRYTLLLEAYTKSCPYDNVPYSLTDIMALYTGMFSIEATVGKFDLNNDNTLSSEEAEVGYRHFKKGLKRIVLEVLNRVPRLVEKENEEDEDWKLGWLYKGVGVDNIVEGVYKYLIKHKVMPTTKNVLEIGIRRISEFPEANREAIARVLVIMQDLAEPLRKTRYERVGQKYYTKDERCFSKLAPGEKELKRDQYNCLVNNNCR